MIKFTIKIAFIFYLSYSSQLINLLRADQHRQVATGNTESDEYDPSSSSHTLKIQNKTSYSLVDSQAPTQAQAQAQAQNSEANQHTIILKSNNEKQTSLKLKMYTREQVEYAEKYLYSLNEDIEGKYSLSELENFVINLKFHAVVYNDLVEHNYESFKDLSLAGGPEVNQELCLDDLRDLIKRTERLTVEKHASRDVNLHRLLDTFGRTPSGVLLGGLSWPGFYRECKLLKIQKSDRKELSTRFCFAQLKHKHPMQINITNDYFAVKVGACLPKTCDSLNYKNKFQLIQTLVEFNMREIDKGERILNDLYCLPDEESPLRVWWRQPKTLITVIIFTAWLGALIYSTIKFKEQQKADDQAIFSDKDNQVVSSGRESSLTANSNTHIKRKSESCLIFELYRSLSIINNLKVLFRTRNEENEQQKQKQSPEENRRDQQVKIDLSILDGIKVLGMSYVITGHVVLCFTTIIRNGLEFKYVHLENFVFFSSNMMPAFAVNGFFTITGILTTYFIFRSSQFNSLITDYRKWLALIMYRYLRIMPTYVVVIAFLKYLIKYTGSGPFWDYGTSSSSPRRHCEEESWWWTFLFGSNLKPVLEQCIPSSWYLANDFQFFLVTPIFIIALHKYPNFGQKLLKLCIVGGSLAGVFSIVFNEAEDLTPISSFMPHGFKTYVTFLAASYTRPQYRIPAYLCGLLIGYKLFKYEQDKINQLNSKEFNFKSIEKSETTKEPHWFDWFIKHGSTVSLLGLLSGILIPAVGLLWNCNKTLKRILFGIVMSSYHVVFSLSIGIYILLAATGHGNKLVNSILSASFWKPLSRLSLCVVLTNLEVCNYLMRTNTQFLYLDFKSHTAINLLCIVTSYIVGIFVCVLVEYPIKSALNNVMTFAASKLSIKKKCD